MKKNLELTINGKVVQLEVEEEMPLLWVLRDELNMTGTKFGCGVAACGACSVLMDGTAVRSCMTPVVIAAGKSITTIEGLATDDALSDLQTAWVDHQVPQCGYCQSGMIIAATSLLRRTPDPTDEDIDAAITNICRCGTYQRIRAAIKQAATKRQPDGGVA